MTKLAQWRQNANVKKIGAARAGDEGVFRNKSVD